MIERLIEQLKRDEGFKLKRYPDSKGIPTIGIGCNLRAHPERDCETCTAEQAEAWCMTDVRSAMADVDAHIPFAKSLDEARRGVLVNMCYNMGINKLLKFALMLAALSLGQYDRAAKEMLDSLWASQVGDRAIRLSVQMRSGVWQ